MKNADLIVKKIKAHVILRCIGYTFLLLVLPSCSRSSDDTTTPEPQETANITGKVMDADGKPYPKTQVIATGTRTKITTTNSEGEFRFRNLTIGNYTITIRKPLRTDITSAQSVPINLRANQDQTANFTIAPRNTNALVVIGSVDIFGEINDVNGNPPTGDNTALYAKNVFDPPLGLLTPIEDPTDNPVILSEWKAASGSVFAQCDGNSATVDITLSGLIPDGTYTFWLNFLNKAKRPGDPVNIFEDVVKIQALGSGSLNVAIADSNGDIQVSIEHYSCILTEEFGLVMPIIYHLNGNTFGETHIPDAEEASQMLVYFQ